MYGYYSYPFSVESGGIKIEVTEESGLYLYRRECCGEVRENYIQPKEGRIIINPVEPVNLPSAVTSLLQIKFKNLVIEPQSVILIYLTFPVEIGVFLQTGKNIEVIDIFSVSKQKYSLYGSPTNGTIVRYHESNIHRGIPETDIFKEGVLSLTVVNSEKEIANLSHAVFDGWGMKLYYNDNSVSMVAEMNLLHNKTAETRFLSVPLIIGMNKSYEIYMSRKIPVMKKSFIMELGY
jgi:hypothetical protein